MTTDTLLSVDDLRSWYGDVQVLWNVHLSLNSGQSLGIVGRNGAGKSTLLRSIAGVHRPVDGRIVLAGADVSRDSAHQRTRRGLSLVREGAPVFQNLSVMDNIRMGERLAVRRGRDPKTIEDVWEIFPALESMAQKGSGLLSGGQRQMLALATAFMSMPSVLLLDEPSAGLAPEAAATAFDALTRFRNDGMCVLVAEQNVDWLQGITSHRIELESGRVVDAPSVDSGSKDAMDAS